MAVSLNPPPIPDSILRATRPFQWSFPSLLKNRVTYPTSDPQQSAPPADASDLISTQNLPPISVAAAQPIQIGQPAPAVAIPDYQPSRFGNAQVIPYLFAGAGNVVVLQRPTNTRLWLLIVNDTGATIRLNFDAVATAVIGVPIVANGNAWWDAVVPQNNINIFSPGAGTVQVSFINGDLLAS